MAHAQRLRAGSARHQRKRRRTIAFARSARSRLRLVRSGGARPAADQIEPPLVGASPRAARPCRRPRVEGQERSEEHTSELQSLMRISYAVFCLKKKKQTEITRHVLDHYNVVQQTTETSY